MFSYQNNGFYIDNDSLWFDGYRGGFLSKIVTPEGNAGIFTKSFEDHYSEKYIDLYTTHLTTYTADGKVHSSTDMNEQKRLDAEKAMYKVCKKIEHKCGR